MKTIMNIGKLARILALSGAMMIMPYKTQAGIFGWGDYSFTDSATEKISKIFGYALLKGSTMVEARYSPLTDNRTSWTELDIIVYAAENNPPNPPKKGQEIGEITIKKYFNELKGNQSNPKEITFTNKNTESLSEFQTVETIVCNYVPKDNKYEILAYGLDGNLIDLTKKQSKIANQVAKDFADMDRNFVASKEQLKVTAEKTPTAVIAEQTTEPAPELAKSVSITSQKEYLAPAKGTQQELETNPSYAPSYNK